MHAHVHPHTHICGVLASGSCLATEVKHTSPSLATLPSLDAFLAKEHSLSFHRVMGSWYYNVAGITNTYFFSLTKKIVVLYLEDIHLEIGRQTIQEYPEVC